MCSRKCKTREKARINNIFKVIQLFFIIFKQVEYNRKDLKKSFDEIDYKVKNFQIENLIPWDDLTVN